MPSNNMQQNVLSIDVEEWFHILQCPSAPQQREWDRLESRVERNVDRILAVLHEHGVRATFFWLGWMAERHKSLLRKCAAAGHEIASHGYAHVLPLEVGRRKFREDLERAKGVLEHITGGQVRGFRVAGFGIDHKTEWAFGVIRGVGYEYDASVFPSRHGVASAHRVVTGPYVIDTEAGPLAEVPLSAVNVCGYQLFVFGGGYLRLAPRWLIRWGITRLHGEERPVIVYLHPREIDAGQPRLRLGVVRRFRYYVNIETTLSKLVWLCSTYRFVPMRELAGTCWGGGESCPRGRAVWGDDKPPVAV